MPFEKVETQQVDFPALERTVLEFWQRIDAFEKLRKKNRNGPRWSFLDGPITANNPMGVHHAWGRTYKDAYQRYFAMTGHDLRYQNGFDCQGLWVEVEVEKELKLQSKRDIENLVPGDPFASIDRFVQLCKERVDRFARTILPFASPSDWKQRFVRNVSASSSLICVQCILWSKIALATARR